MLYFFMSLLSSPALFSSGTLDTLARSHIPLEEAALDIFYLVYFS
jgi:hypothetical protein